MSASAKVKILCNIGVSVLAFRSALAPFSANGPFHERFQRDTDFGPQPAGAEYLSLDPRNSQVLYTGSTLVGGRGPVRGESQCEWMPRLVETSLASARSS